ncbi:DUF2855 family protein [Hydrogenophaga sp.]|uniref:DUF2855 family protein n=1 Tax=Hydrogenophaga sp. TaxID=1904254 RepID=UPI003F6E4A2B
MRELQVNKQDLRQVRFVDVEPSRLADGAARLRLDLFALTSNNLTYAAMGDSFAGYWDFFPGTAEWGRPPAWGFGTVIESRAEGVVAGACCYGFFPISETLDVTPVRAGAGGFVDGAAHRAGKAPVYNHYADRRTDPAHHAEFEQEQPLVRPLYPSGWWTAERVLQDHPARVLISSASSKTALSAADRLRRQGAAELVALTSARHKAFVSGTGLYDDVHTYDDLTGLSAGAPTTYVDFLGREELTAAVHRRLGASLKCSLLVGATDWAAKPGGLQSPRDALSGPTPEVFFVPEYASRRLQTDRALGVTMLRDLRVFYADSRAYFRVRREAGAAAITAAWSRLAAADTAPCEGLVLSF